MSLFENIKAIKAKIKERIANELGDAVNSVVVGDKERLHNVKPPFVWVLPIDSHIDTEGMMLIHEDWKLHFWVFSFLKQAKNLEDAADLAEETVIKAVGSLMVDPVTGNQNRKLDNLVRYIKRVGWSPGDSRVNDTGETIFGAGIHIIVDFENEEVT